MKLFKQLILTSVMCVMSSTAMATDVDGVNFPDKLTLEGTTTPLQLNGVGYRTKFIFDVYIGALYTQAKVNSRDAVQALKGPSRIQMNFVYSEVSKEKLVNGWNEGFEENSSTETLNTLSDKINQFNAMFPTLLEGDVVLLDYIPGKGTKVNIKGVDKGVIEGEDFHAALLDIWLGEEPADDDLKDAMLGL